MTRVALLAPSRVLRAGLEALLDRHPGLVVVAAAAGDGGWDAVRAAEPDVLVRVLDPGGSALAHDDDSDAPPQPLPTVVLLTEPAERPDWIVAVLRDGARTGVRAVLPADVGAEELGAAIDAVAAGLVVLPVEAADVVLAGLAAPPEPPEPPGARTLAPAPLTAREREVLALVAEGLPNKVIGPRLGISEHTVKAHVAAIFEKLGVGTRAEAVVTAARMGLLLL